MHICTHPHTHTHTRTHSQLFASARNNYEQEHYVGIADVSECMNSSLCPTRLTSHSQCVGEVTRGPSIRGDCTEQRLSQRTILLHSMEDGQPRYASSNGAPSNIRTWALEFVLCKVTILWRCKDEFLHARIHTHTFR